MEYLSHSIIEFLGHLSHDYGTGVLVNDVLALLVIVSFLSLFIAMVAFRKSAALKMPPGIERAASVAGRVEKLEMTLNEFRIETVRNLELFRGDLGYLKQELSEIRKILRSLSSSSGGSVGGGGAPPSGSFPFSGSGEGHKFSGPMDHEALPSAPAGIEAEFQDSIPQEPIIEPEPVQPSSLSSKLKKTRFGLLDKIRGLFKGSSTVDESVFDDLEAQLVTSDLGIKMASSLVGQLKDEAKKGNAVDEEQVFNLLREKIFTILKPADNESILFNASRWKGKHGTGPYVVMVVGVNGVGKTTTVAKLAQKYKQAGAKVMLAAADTFRAAAVEQICEWGNRVGVPVICGANEAKPATVVYDAMMAANKENVDVLIIDTAGRLHTKSNLMQELEGLRNAVSRHSESGPHETILVVDGSTGQNALSQAREFNAAVKISGLIVTKLDGTSKGGIVIAIKDELAVPIHCIGVGESADDLRVFNANEFIAAILDKDDSDLAKTSAGNAGNTAHGEVRRRRREESSATLV